MPSFEAYCEKKRRRRLSKRTIDRYQPLGQEKCADPRFTERFAMFFDGSEYANALTESHQPLDQSGAVQPKSRPNSGRPEANDVEVDSSKRSNTDAPGRWHRIGIDPHGQ
jgi:lysyl-tRNA synthetase class II